MTLSINTIAKYGIALLLFLMLPSLVFAGPVVRSGDSVSVEQGQVVEGDFYGGANSVIISGEVKGDAYVGARTVTVNAPIAADLSVIGATVQIHESVADDVRVVGGDITIAGTVTGDVVVFGGSLHILSTASIKGDVLFFGGDLQIDGPIDGSVFGMAERTRVDAFVGKDVRMESTLGLTLGDHAEITGNVTYTGGPDLVRAQNAVVSGTIHHEELAIKTASIESFLIPLFSMLFAALVLFMLGRSRFLPLVRGTEISYGIQGLLGLGVFFGTPFIAVILTISMLGTLVGIALFALYIAFCVLAFMLSGMIVGSFLMKLVNRKKDIEITLMSVIIGTGIIFVALFIPYVGFFVVFGVFLITLGGLVRMCYKGWA